MRTYCFTAATALFLASSASSAAVIQIVSTDSDSDNIAKIEGAQPGDEVVVGPGTYKFRVYLEGQGTATQPIVIRAEDPNNRPVWDLDGDVVANWPGSYSGGDRGRAIWQITGSYYEISGLEFHNGSDGSSGDSAGLRLKSCDHVTLRDCVFYHNDNGLQGAGTDTVVEFCNFDGNGLPNGSEGSHNLYIHGGDITVRYSYIHDARRSQNIHIRANRSVFEYNWIARSHSYMGDMMPCTVDPCPGDQTMLLRGNVFVRGTPTNDGQVFVMYNDQQDPNISFTFTMVNNTIVGNGDGAALVHFGNENPSMNRMQTAVLNNNVIYDVARVLRVDDSGLSNWAFSGTNNWISQGTADLGSLQSSVMGADPGFTNASSLNFVPGAGSPLIAAADGSVADLPDKEYYRDETLAMQWRARASVQDIGAFESTTTGDGVGPYGSAGAAGSGGSGGAGGSSGSGGSGGGTAGSGGGTSGSGGTSATGGASGAGATAGAGAPIAAPTEEDSGCSCSVPARSVGRGPWFLLGLRASMPSG